MVTSSAQLSSQVLPEHFVVGLDALRTRFQALLRGVPVSRTYVLANAIVDGLGVMRQEFETLSPSPALPPEGQRAIAAQIFKTPSPPKGARWLREQSAPPPAPLPGENKRRVSNGYVRLPATMVDRAVLDAIDAAAKLYGRRLPSAPLSRAMIIREAISRGLSKLGGMLDFHEKWRAFLPNQLSPLEALIANTPNTTIPPAPRGRPPGHDASPLPDAPVHEAPLVARAIVVNAPDWSKVDLSEWQSADNRSLSTPTGVPTQQAIEAKSKARARTTLNRTDASPPQTHARARRAKRTATSPPQDEGGDGDPDPDPEPDGPALAAPIPVRLQQLELDDNLRHLLDFLIEKALSS